MDINYTVISANEAMLIAAITITVLIAIVAIAWYIIKK